MTSPLLYFHCFRNYLTQDGLVSWLRDPADFKTIQDFTNFIHKNQVNIVIGLHALHTSAYLKGSSYFLSQNVCEFILKKINWCTFPSNNIKEGILHDA